MCQSSTVERDERPHHEPDLLLAADSRYGGPVEHARPLAALCATIVGIGAATGIAAPIPGTVRVLSVPGAVTAIGADGARVAIATRSAAGCDHVVVWTTPGTATQTYTAEASCAGAAVHGITQVAVAGNRVEWLATEGGNLLDMTLEAATLGRPKVATVLWVENEAGAQGGVDGDWIGALHGDGGLLVFDSWHECALSRRQGFSCRGLLSGGVFYTKQTLWKLVGLTKARIRSGDDAYEAVAADAGRIALRGITSGSVVLVDDHGRRLGSGTITGATSSGIALQGSQLVTLRGTSLTVWNAANGHLDRIVALPPGTGPPLLRDVQNGLAVYVRGRSVRVVRLADSKQAAFVVPVRRVVDAQLEQSGLVYAYNATSGSARGRVVFVPWAQLVAKLG
jgi:hypothetical protein